MENKNYAIFFHVFICKTKYPEHIVILCDGFRRGQQWEVWKIRTNKYNGTSTMRRTCLLVLESYIYKVEGKLLVSSKTVQIM
jgi:hypothetical protein